MEALTQADKLTLIIILFIVSLPGLLALVRDYQRNQGGVQTRQDELAKERLDFEREQAKWRASQEEQRMATLTDLAHGIVDHGKSTVAMVEAMKSMQDSQDKRTELAQKQSLTLDAVNAKVESLPSETKAELQKQLIPIVEKLNTIEKDIVSVKAEILAAIVAAVAPKPTDGKLTAEPVSPPVTATPEPAKPAEGAPTP